MMNKTIVTVLFGLVYGAAAAAEPSETLSLSAAVSRVLSVSPLLTQSRERVSEAEAGLSAARLGALPKLSAQSVVTRGDDPVYAFGSILEQRHFAARNFAIDALNYPGYVTNVKSSLQLGVPLFTGFALSDRRELERLEVGAAQAGENSASQQVRFQTLSAFLRLMLDAALLKNVEERISAATGEIEDARALKSRGLVLGSDFYAAEALLGALESERSRINGDFSAARAVFAALLRTSSPVEPSGALAEADYASEPLPSLTDAALQDRRDIAQAQIAEDSAKVLSRRERLSPLPTIEAFASLESDTSNFGSNAASRLGGVRAVLPFGDPGYFARRRRAESAARAARAGRESLEQAARIEIAERYEAWRAAARSVPIMRDTAEKAAKSLELFRPLYHEGRQSIIDVLRAEEALMKAEAGYQEAVFGAHLGHAALMLAAGRLDAAAVAEVERKLRSEK